ncbi:type II toxin-antitoxin system PemK/MazF family toxin [Deinococcus aestuarii]|uniref:type II toxin-antitoxin system PemK/MazF family toxin n=1 Tax=Deinococcus aestuarii TaxID=2774531 RepID=UPI001C0BD554|nr:type II toxin-antitoxin system PemK/MazF family toxin [Deinococcus aestuarii]
MKRAALARGDLVEVGGAAGGPGARALVLTPEPYNARSGHVLVAPVSGEPRGNHFEVALGAQEVALADCVYPVRVDRLRGVGRVPAMALQEVLAKLEALLLHR